MTLRSGPRRAAEDGHPPVGRGLAQLVVEPAIVDEWIGVQDARARPESGGVDDPGLLLGRRVVDEVGLVGVEPPAVEPLGEERVADLPPVEPPRLRIEGVVEGELVAEPVPDPAVERVGIEQPRLAHLLEIRGAPVELGPQRDRHSGVQSMGLVVGNSVSHSFDIQLWICTPYAIESTVLTSSENDRADGDPCAPNRGFAT